MIVLFAAAPNILLEVYGVCISKELNDSRIIQSRDSLKTTSRVNLQWMDSDTP